MYTLDQTHRKLVLVCTNNRQDGRACCAEQGAVDLHRKLKNAVAARDPRIRVSQSGCLDHCNTGVTVVIMPDNIWLGRVMDHDIPELVNLITS
ncbi:ferredoxin [Candidatus Uhrbacteria bacterium CG10_big_fil_rev_8_21_14_0_10_48_16]|uniref:Ferredoxin n=1 Tax=Candidatus Uhrbacteria bacterium CG10_big_fil_rev_8_21_14_0_10_48_16 TaxID=1975038 RepID=A0A2M8LIA1_9BACT|nr:MAG: ferredoxin [Candidatus Uhrbacteria bacterium CG10_big_fil_rev_8_21_14_0_10_48_16]